MLNAVANRYLNVLWRTPVSGFRALPPSSSTRLDFLKFLSSADQATSLINFFKFEFKIKQLTKQARISDDRSTKVRPIANIINQIFTELKKEVIILSGYCGNNTDTIV